MRVALVADIHSNLHALRSALEIIDSLDVDLVACAGDIVGYGAFPNECCEIIEDRCDHVVLGNHDRAALSRDISRMNPYAAAAALWTADEMSDGAQAFLRRLSDSARFDIDGDECAVFHGSNEDPDEYVYEDGVSENMLSDANCRYMILGHTHIPYVRSFEKGCVLNPGSIGQPRDRNPRGSLAVIDTETEERVRIMRFDYPIDEAGDAIVSEGLPKILAERLHIGW